MKKILMIVLMTVFTGLVAFADMFAHVPDDIFLDMGAAKYLHSLVMEDVKYKGFNLKENGYESSIDDDLYGFIFYQIARFENEEREIVVIYHEGKRYFIHTGSKEILPDYIFTVREIRVYDEKEERHLYNMTCYAEDGEIFYEFIWDWRTLKSYTVDRLEVSDD